MPKPFLKILGPENPMLPQQPVIDVGVPSQEVPALEVWDAHGDLYLPRNPGAENFVPAIEAVPPQRPSPLERVIPLEFEPHGIQIFVDTAAAPRQGTQLGFSAHSVLVDNLSSKWIYFPSAQRYVPPSTVGAMLLFQIGTQIAQFTQITPTGHGDGAVGVGGPITTVWYEQYQPTSAGVAATV